MKISGDDVVSADGYPRKFVFTAHGGDFDEFETGLDADPTVAEFTVLKRFEDSAYYIVTYDITLKEKGIYHIAVEEGIVYLTFEMQDGNYCVQARVPTREALATLREYCRENDLSFKLDRIYQEETLEADEFGLTDAQRTALLEAYERGYFEFPREATLDAIGEELGISRQAVSDRLRRGHKQLIKATIG